MAEDFGRRDIAEILVESSGYVKPEDKRGTAEVVRKILPELQGLQKRLARQDTATGEIHQRTIDKFASMPGKPHQKGSPWVLEGAGLTFNTDNRYLRIIGYFLAGFVVAATLYVGFSIRNGLDEIQYEKEKAARQQTEFYNLLDRTKR